MRIAGPVAVDTEHLLDDVAHGAFAALEFGDVARCLDHLGGRIGRADRNPHRAHALQIGNVVAHVDDVGRIDPFAGEVLAHGLDLVHAVEVVVADAEHPETVFEGFAASAGDDADAVSHPQGVGQGIAVLGVVVADEVAVDGRDDAAVGHHAVDIEDEGPTACYCFLEVFHISLLIC